MSWLKRRFVQPLLSLIFMFKFSLINSLWLKSYLYDFLLKYVLLMENLPFENVKKVIITYIFPHTRKKESLTHRQFTWRYKYIAGFPNKSLDRMINLCSKRFLAVSCDLVLFKLHKSYFCIESYQYVFLFDVWILTFFYNRLGHFCLIEILYSLHVCLSLKYLCNCIWFHVPVKHFHTYEDDNIAS